MRIGIIGGGINGICCAWVLAQAGHEVDLYERGILAGETSRASSKLLHGGLRYLEQFEFRLVREALKERDGWLQKAPDLAKPLRLVLPIYRHSRRNRWLVGTGLFLYDHLAGKSILPPARWLSTDEILLRDPCLRSQGLLGGYEFSDGQMDDYKLALWVAEQARQAGARLHENTEVMAINTQGHITTEDCNVAYDRIINVAGPWAEKLLEKSGVSTKYRLDTVRGSHLVLDRACAQAYLLEAPDEQRIFFVLPWKGKTLVGTTEVRVQPTGPVECSPAECNYLLAAYNHYSTSHVNTTAVLNSFAGLRPLLCSNRDPNRATREYAIERQEKLINVFGGKWTTALALAGKVNEALLDS